MDPRWPHLVHSFRPNGTPPTPEQMAHRRLVLDQIEQEPSKFRMDYYELEEDDGCGTTRCVAGWSQFLAVGRVRIDTVDQDAVRAMGLSEREFAGTGPLSPLSINGLFYTYENDAIARMRVLADSWF